MAEYRTGHFQQADIALLASAEGASENSTLAGTSGFYRAMSLFQQGKRTDAEELFVATEATMNPLPADEQIPLADGRNHDDLILWLSYKEAKALLNDNGSKTP